MKTNKSEKIIKLIIYPAIYFLFYYLLEYSINLVSGIYLKDYTRYNYPFGTQYCSVNTIPATCVPFLPGIIKSLVVFSLGYFLYIKKFSGRSYFIAIIMAFIITILSGMVVFVYAVIVI